MEPDPLVEEWDAELVSGDPLGTPGYAERLAGLPHESVRTGRTATHVVVEGCFESIGGSMGVVHGERVVRAFDRARQMGLPVVCRTRSGGARMQEGMVSLLQLGRVAGAVRRHREAGLLSVAVLQSPTTGGVLASYASLCDLRAAEAGAVIGFAGPRIVADTTGEEVEGISHSAETAFAAGLVDAVLPADRLDDWVRAALGAMDRPLTARVPASDRATASDASDPHASEAWNAVQGARRPDRPTGLDVAAELCDSWVEINGTDPTLRAGLARIGERRVVVLASDRRAGTGRPTPAAFALARRAVALAGRLGLPVVSLVDTPGAEPGSASENAGIAAAIAETFAALDGVAVPTLSVCVGEGGSGGALALAWCDTALIQEGAVFSVMGPEGAAVILARDVAKAPEVAAQLALTSGELVALGVVDDVVPDEPAATAAAIRAALPVIEVGRRRSRPDAVSAAALREI